MYAAESKDEFVDGRSGVERPISRHLYLRLRPAAMADA
jgi:hypothetical protein